MTPGVVDVTNWAREFGVIVAVLFFVLFSGLALLWYIIAKQGKEISEMKEMLAIHCEGVKTSDETASQKADTLAKELSSFRSSERDLLSAMKETVAVHAKDCAAGQNNILELRKDVNAVFQNTEKLVNVLLYVRRTDNDDTGRQGKINK